jgi:ATP-dependent protease HslVU (ClpYQ) peptidase subunit
MTIVIGRLQLLSRLENDTLITESGLVMAADTEETAGDFKRSVPKLEEFSSPSGSLIIGGAGSSPQIETITQLLEDKFQSWDNKDPDRLQETFRETIKEHYQTHVLPWPEITEREDNDFSLIIGLALPAFDDLRLLVSQKGMLRRTKKNAAIGIGASYASDLMEEHLSHFGGAMPVAVLAAIYIIYRVKRNRLFCGKETHVWQMVNHAHKIPDYVIVKAEEIFKQFDDFTSGQLFAVLSGGDKNNEYFFNENNFMEGFREFRGELGQLFTEMEKHQQ